MAKPLPFEYEKLIISVIYCDETVLSLTLAKLKEEFGEWDLVSEEILFSEKYSGYYDAELGGKGKRRIYSFKRHVDPSLQADIKIKTNAIEDSFGRRINLDPGLLNDGRLLLPTTKKLGFRTPLKDGIYSDYALFYSRGAFHKLPWTYRDYQSEAVQSFLLKVRKKYLSERREALKNQGKSSE